MDRWRKVLVAGVAAALLAAGGVAAWRWNRPHPRPMPVVKFRGPKLSCDVLVVGGTPSGVAAALTAARRGAKVVLVEERPHLGGDIVGAMLNMFDVPVHRDGTSPVAEGVFGEFYRALGFGFDIVQASRLFDRTVKAEPNIRLLLRTKLRKVLKRGTGGGTVVGARFERLTERHGAPLLQITARCSIDATNDGSFASLAGGHYWIGRGQSGIDRKMQSAGLLFSVSGVKWSAIQNYVNTTALVPAGARAGHQLASDAAPTASREVAAGKVRPGKLVRRRLGGGAGNYLWERGEIIRDYVPHGRDVVVLSINFGRQHDGSVVLNTLNAVNVNGLDWKSKQHARQEMTQELKWFLPYLRRKMPGFKKARVKLIAPELYIRETRHIQGFMTLEVADIRAQTTFPDAVARVSYPIDLHPYKKGDNNPYGPERYFYTLPLRSMVPQAVDGVFVASRSLSASFSGAGSARVIPITMAAGQACGMAAWLCASEDATPHQMAQSPHWWARLQDELHKDGITTTASPDPVPTVVLRPRATPLSPADNAATSSEARPLLRPQVEPGLQLRRELHPPGSAAPRSSAPAKHPRAAATHHGTGRKP